MEQNHVLNADFTQEFKRLENGIGSVYSKLIEIQQQLEAQEELILNLIPKRKAPDCDTEEIFNKIFKKEESAFPRNELSVEPTDDSFQSFDESTDNANQPFVEYIETMAKHCHRKLNVPLVLHRIEFRSQKYTHSKRKIVLVFKNSCGHSPKKVECSVYPSDKHGITYRFSCCKSHGYRKNNFRLNQLNHALANATLGSYTAKRFESEVFRDTK